MNFKNLAIPILLLLLTLSSKVFSEDAKTLLENTLKDQKTEAVNYVSGCSTCKFPIFSHPKAKLYSTINFKDFDISILSLQEIEQVFKELASHKEIPFEYPLDGCYARAQAIAKILEDKGIISGKAFVEGRLLVDSPEFGELAWSYHVASFVMVKVDNKIIPYIIDPSLSDRPLPHSEWKKKMTTKNETNITNDYFTTRFYYTPNEKIIQKDELGEVDNLDYQETNKKNREILYELRAKRALSEIKKMDSTYQENPPQKNQVVQ